MEENKKEKKQIKISFNKFIVLTISILFIVIFLITNIYAHALGKPNIFTAVRNLFNVNKAEYQVAEEEINITKESNGIKLTLKTAAMDDNVLILKYIAEGDKLHNEFFTYQDFEEKMIEYAKMSYSLEGWKVGEDNYKNITKEEISQHLANIKVELLKNGLSEENAEILLELGKKAYLDYVGIQLGKEDNTYEVANKEIEQTIAMFQSKLSTNYSIITSDDMLMDIKIKDVSQTIEKENNNYIIYTIYNIDTILEVESEFDLKVKISKIGTIEGNWDYSIKLNNSQLNTMVETINFKDRHVTTVYEHYYEDDFGQTEKIDIVVSELKISKFSSVLNVRTEAYTDDDNLMVSKEIFENEMFPLIFIVTNKDGEIIGKSSSDAYSNQIVDKFDYKIINRIILKGVDQNTEELNVKVYSNKDNSLIENFNINLMDERKTQTELEKTDNTLSERYESKTFGIEFDYPKNWDFFEDEAAENTNSDGEGYIYDGEAYYRSNGVVLHSPKDKDGYLANISICMRFGDDEGKEFDIISPESATEIGNIEIDEVETTFRVKDRIDGDIKNKSYEARIVKNNVCYDIYYSARETLYFKYYDLFQNIIKSIQFKEPEWTINLPGDVNGDWSVNVEDYRELSKFLEGSIYLNEANFNNADLISPKGIVNQEDLKELEWVFENNTIDNQISTDTFNDEERKNIEENLSCNYINGIEIGIGQGWQIEEKQDYYYIFDMNSANYINIYKEIDLDNKEDCLNEKFWQKYYPNSNIATKNSATVLEEDSVTGEINNHEWFIYAWSDGENMFLSMITEKNEKAYIIEGCIALENINTEFSYMLESVKFIEE